MPTAMVKNASERSNGTIACLGTLCDLFLFYFIFLVHRTTPNVSIRLYYHYLDS